MSWPLFALVPFLFVFGSLAGVLLSEILATDEGATTWAVLLMLLALALLKRRTLSSWIAFGAVALSLTAGSFVLLSFVLLWLLPRG